MKTARSPGKSRVFGPQSRYDMLKGIGGKVFDLPPQYQEMLAEDRAFVLANRRERDHRTAERRARR